MKCGAESRGEIIPVVKSVILVAKDDRATEPAAYIGAGWTELPAGVKGDGFLSRDSIAIGGAQQRDNIGAFLGPDIQQVADLGIGLAGNARLGKAAIERWSINLKIGGLIRRPRELP